MSSTKIEEIIDQFKSFTANPVKFLSVQSESKDDIKNLIKTVYDFTKICEKDVKKKSTNALPKLIVRDFDEEQIWQEIELQNTECWDSLVWNVASNVSTKSNLIFPIEIQKSSKHSKSDHEELTEDENLLSEDDQFEAGNQQVCNEEPIKMPKKTSTQSNIKSSIVDDKFFKLSEMEQFLLNEEKKEGKTTVSDSDEESIDMFNYDNDESGDRETNVMYSDFFGEQENTEKQDMIKENEDSEGDYSVEENYMTEKKPQKKNKVTFAGLSSDDASSDDDQSDNNSENIPTVNNNIKKSEFELRQERLQQQIAKLEEKTLQDAPWQLKGEVDANKRPENSLLQEVVDFDLTSRPPPIITEETTVTLEDIIKRRIKDKAWDDVEKKEKPVEDQLSFHKPEVIDQSKSKLSLAQVYEAEYLKQKQALSGDNEEEKEPELHTEIREAMSKLFSKLDALCHYHYTPKPPQAEVKIVSNTPAISMEEVAPVATSDAALLAPEEIKKKHKGDLMSKEERSKTDKNRERRKKKNLQRKKGKVEKVTEHRNTKKGVESTDKSLKTSKAFFQQLNDDSSGLIMNKKRKIGK